MTEQTCKPYFSVGSDGDLDLVCRDHGVVILLEIRVDSLDEGTIAAIFAYHRAYPQAGILGSGLMTQAHLDRFIEESS